MNGCVLSVHRLRGCRDPSKKEINTIEYYAVVHDLAAHGLPKLPFDLS